MKFLSVNKDGSYKVQDGKKVSDWTYEMLYDIALDGEKIENFNVNKNGFVLDDNGNNLTPSKYKKTSSTHLSKAHKNKNDEFYTKYETIEKEMKWHNDEEFKDKIIYCPCDDYTKSNFVKYFIDNGNRLGIKSLIATSLKEGDNYYRLDFDTGNETKRRLRDDDNVNLGGYVSGDYRSKECQYIYNESDMIITNPPFSLGSQFLEWCGGKQYLLIENMLIIKHIEIFNKIKDGQLWFGGSVHSGGIYFVTQNEDGSEYKEVNVNSAIWLTNMVLNEVPITLTLTKKLNDIDAGYLDTGELNVNKVEDIPIDYTGEIAAPISICKYVYEGFPYKLIRVRNHPKINKTTIFARAVIRKKEDNM